MHPINIAEDFKSAKQTTQDLAQKNIFDIRTNILDHKR